MTEQFAGEVMTSFNYVMIPTQGNWFQTNSLEYESVNRVIVLIFCVCFANGKDIAVQPQSTFVAVLWLRKTEILDWVWILVLVSYDFQNILTILTQFL